MTKSAKTGLLVGIAVAVVIAIILIFTLSGKKPAEETVMVVEEEAVAPAPALPENAPTATEETAPTIPQPETPAQPQTQAQAPKGQSMKTPVQEVIVVEEDETFTLAFIRDLAAFVVGKFQPKGSAAAPDKAVGGVTFKGVNTRYGLDPMGIEVQRADLKTAREDIFDYVFSQAVISTLFDLYAQEFVDTMVGLAARTSKTYLGQDGKKVQKPLTPAQTATMLRLDADKLATVADALAALAGLPELTDLMARYFKADERVEKTNLAFQSILNRIQPDSHTPEGLSQSQRLELQTASSDLKSAIVAREKLKQRVLERVGESCSQACQSDPELFYMAKWAYRRLMDNPGRDRAIVSLAEAMDRLAAMMRAKADAL